MRRTLLAFSAGLTVVTVVNLVAFTNEHVWENKIAGFVLFLCSPVLASFVASLLEPKRKILVGLMIIGPACLSMPIVINVGKSYVEGEEVIHRLSFAAMMNIPFMAVLCAVGVCFALALARCVERLTNSR